MTAVQQAIYFAMLGEQATSGPLPTDLDELAWLATRHTRDLSEQDFHDAWAGPLRDCFEEQDGKLVNLRMQQEVDAAEARSANARKAIEARWKGRKGRCDTGVSRAKNESNTIQDRTGQDRTGQDSTDSPAESRRAGARDLLALALDETQPPPWVEEVCREYEQHRRELKAKKLTARGWRQKIADLVKHGEAPGRASLALSVSNGWAGLFLEKRRQAPPVGGWYKGPPLKDQEARRMRNDIRDRYKALAADFMLSEEDAFRMARADNDWHMHDYDWKTGMRDDPPPMSGSSAADVQPEDASW